ncbi:MAG: PHP domain-containing protein [Acidimicrobiia bacterium]|nr:PHP domain-containing protein [Acidimicrobiia bacterium]
MIDLHSHSTVSDGTDSPTEILRLASDAGLNALALSDHDTLDHLDEASTAADRFGVRLIPACEISCEVGDRAPGTMHLLVYFLDDPNGPLGSRLAAVRDSRENRNTNIVKRLNELGVEITIDEVLEVAGDGTVGRPHIADVLMARGHVESVQEAFDRWLAKGQPAYVERLRLGPEESIELAHAGNAVTSIAHPTTLDLEDDDLESFIAEMAASGLDALECVYSRYTPEQRTSFSDLAGRHGLAVTGGSDYHGTYKPGLRLGVGEGDLAVPDELLTALEARRPAG